MSPRLALVPVSTAIEGSPEPAPGSFVSWNANPVADTCPPPVESRRTATAVVRARDKRLISSRHLFGWFGRPAAAKQPEHGEDGQEHSGWERRRREFGHS